MKSSYRYFTCIAFAVVLLSLSLLDVLAPDVAFSEMENRYLKEKPSFSLGALFDSKYTQAYEKYVDDQFFAREQWMRTKSDLERMMFKMENNDIVFGADGYLFNKYLTVPKEYEKNIKAIKAFSEKYPSAKMRFALAPNSYTVLKDKVPFGLYNVDQKSVYEQTKAGLGSLVETVDLMTPLQNAYKTLGNPLYFKLDHHWTIFGAYEAYKALIQAEGLISTPLEADAIKRVENFYGTFYSAAKRFDLAGDTLYYDSALDQGIDVTVATEAKESMYDLKMLEGKDKYGMFLYNNPPFLTLKTTASEALPKKILVFKDSYANSVLPFMAKHYAQIDVVDLRYYNGKVSELMASGNYDEVLFLYNFITFSQSKDSVKLLY